MNKYCYLYSVLRLYWKLTFKETDCKLIVYIYILNTKVGIRAQKNILIKTFIVKTHRNLEPIQNLV